MMMGEPKTPNGGVNIDCSGAALEPIAIVGFSFRFPGGAVSDETFWDMMASGRNVSSEFPPDRLNINGFYNPDPEKRNVMHTRMAHFLQEDLRNFDAPFFGMSPAEAAGLDPQQRGLLETAYHAFENAGIPLKDVAGSKTSVHVGSFSNDFITFAHRDVQQMAVYAATGCSQTLLSNRLSWYFNLRGASLTVDTACSSGLVALDLACRELWSGQADMALAGGASMILSPEMNISLSNMGFLSPDGRSYSFDHRANGYGRGEGFAVLVLKPLTKALRDGNSIRALIRSTGTNSDGFTRSGITQPSKEMQVNLIKETYRKAKLDMDSTRFFEAHGTGTAVGDPTEARAIGESFRRFHQPDAPIYVGAVKSNIGHLEGTSGLAGVIKAVLAMERGVIPPNSNFEKLNDDIDDEFFGLKFPAECAAWPEVHGGIRRASVNSFGYGGTNAHAVLDDVHSYLQSLGTTSLTTPISSPVSSHPSHPKLVILSAADSDGLSRQAQVHQAFIDRLRLSPDASQQLHGYAYTLATRRTMLSWKAFAVVDVAGEPDDLVSAISSPMQGLPSKSRLGLIFTGQGSQWPGMGRELLVCPTFRKSIELSQSYLTELGWKHSLNDLLTQDAQSGLVHQADVSQVLTTSIQLALVDLLEWLGLEPSVVVGHSSGEIAAAYSAGHISHRSAMVVSCFRGSLSFGLEQKKEQRYSMMAVGLSEDEANAEISQFETETHIGPDEPTLTISCLNSPQSTTISGPEHLLKPFLIHLKKKEIFARQLKVSVGYHSPQMQQIAEDYRRSIGNLEAREKVSKPIMVSSVTGGIADRALVCNADYWVDNMTSPVNFLGAVRTCSAAGLDRDMQELDQNLPNHVSVDAWVEVGPHSALQGPLRQILKEFRDDRVSYISALVREKHALKSVLTAAGYLHCQNFELDFKRVFALASPDERSDVPPPPAGIPEYPFNHSTMYWEEAPSNKQHRFRPHGNHDFLGTRIGDLLNKAEAQWKMQLSQDALWVRDHKVQGSVLYPAGGTLVMAIEAARQLVTDKPPLAYVLENIDLSAPVRIPPSPESIELRIHMSSVGDIERSDDLKYNFRVFIHIADGVDREVCSGTIACDYGRTAADISSVSEDELRISQAQRDLASALQDCSEAVDTTSLYRDLRDRSSLDYGPVFQSLSNIAHNSHGQAIADLLSFESKFASSHVVHPSRLDGVFQAGFAAMIGVEGPRSMIPTRARRIWIAADGFGHGEDTSEKILAKVMRSSQRTAAFCFDVFSHADQSLKARIETLELTSISGDSETPKTLEDVPYTQSFMEWKVDMNTLSPLDVKRLCQEGNATPIAALNTYLDHFVHKLPNMRFCEVIPPLSKVTETVLDVISDSRIGSRFEEYLLLGTDSSSLGSHSNNRRVSFMDLGEAFGEDSQGLSQSYYDVLVVHGPMDDTINVSEFLSRLRSTLKPGGRLILSDASTTLNSWEQLLKAHELIGEKIVFAEQDTSNNDNTMVVISKDSSTQPLANGKSLEPTTFVVLDTNSSVQTEVAHSICHELGLPTTSCITLSDAAVRARNPDLKFIMLCGLDARFLTHIDEETFTGLQNLIESVRTLLWVAGAGSKNGDKPDLGYSLTDGLSRVCTYERSQLKLVTLRLNMNGEDAVQRATDNVCKVYDIAIEHPDENGYENEYVELNSRLHINRLTRAKSLDEECYSRANRVVTQKKIGDQKLKINIRVPGLLDSITFMHDNTFTAPLAPHEVDIEIKAIGLNFKDCIVLLGKYDTHLGTEVAGVIKAVGTSVTNFAVGDRVYHGLPDSFRTYGRFPASEIRKIPDGVTFEEAASIPTVFRTAVYCLKNLARLQPGETVLIHRASGGVGQSAIQIALLMGAKVYATVGSAAKKQLLMDTYGIPESHIFYSRDTSFAEGIQRVTGNKGVDIVINSLSGKLLEASMDCLAHFGRFIEIGLGDIYSRQKLPTSAFIKSISFTAFNLDVFVYHRERHSVLMDEIQELLASGKIHAPAPVQVYGLSEVQKAIRHLQGGSSMGKLVIKIDRNEIVPVQAPTDADFMFPADATYVLAGGLGGLGRSIARWLCRRGAKNLIILSRSGALETSKSTLIKELQDSGVKVLCPRVDISNLAELKAALDECAKVLPPIRGCFQGAMVLRDSTFNRMTLDDWHTCLRPKVQGSWNLHEAMPSGMDFFILLSSIVGVHGSGGQANYAAGSTYQDELARYRVSIGEKAASINLGLMIEEGVVAENEALMNRLLHREYILPVTNGQAYTLFDSFCNPSATVTPPDCCHIVTGLETPSNILAKGRSIPRELSRALFRVIHQADAASSASSNPSSGSQTLQSSLAAVPTEAEGVKIAADALRATLSRIIGTPAQDIGFDVPLQQLGIDSLVGLEIRNWLVNEMGADVSVFEIQGNALGDLAKLACGKSTMRPAHWKE